MCLVVRIRDMPEGGLSGVEGDGDPLGGQASTDVQQGFEEAVGDAGRSTVLGGQTPFTSLAEGVEAAEGQRVAVHEQQQGLVGGLGHSQQG